MMRPARPPRNRRRRKPLRDRRLCSHALGSPPLQASPCGAPGDTRHNSLFYNNLEPSPALEVTREKGPRFYLISCGHTPITAMETLNPPAEG